MNFASYEFRVYRVPSLMFAEPAVGVTPWRIHATCFRREDSCSYFIAKIEKSMIDV
jgi:hypothetical protein